MCVHCLWFCMICSGLREIDFFLSWWAGCVFLANIDARLCNYNDHWIEMKEQLATVMRSWACRGPQPTNYPCNFNIFSNQQLSCCCRLHANVYIIQTGMHEQNQNQDEREVNWLKYSKANIYSPDELLCLFSPGLSWPTLPFTWEQPLEKMVPGKRKHGILGDGDEEPGENANQRLHQGRWVRKG